MKKIVFKNGTLKVDKDTYISLAFHPINDQYERNIKFLNSFPDKPYKSKRRKMEYVAGILWEMNKNGLILKYEMLYLSKDDVDKHNDFIKLRERELGKFMGF